MSCIFENLFKGSKVQVILCRLILQHNEKELSSKQLRKKYFISDTIAI
ncbi:hypothetical protein J2T56_002624 [Natronobacillus azotifigens]